MLDTKVQFLKGVGPKVGQKLEKLGIETLSDLFFYYPRNYQDYTRITKIADLSNSQQRVSANDQKTTIKANVLGISNKKTSRRRFVVTEAVVEDGTGSLKVVWFNQPYLAKMLTPGRELILNGKIEYNHFSHELVMESPNRASFPCIVPIYGETAGLSTYFISRLFSKVSKLVEEIPEYLPQEIIDQNQLMRLDEALLNIHQPKNSGKLTEAQKRIAFDELFLISLRANLTKEVHKKQSAEEMKVSKTAIKDFENSLPFSLTEDQKKASEVILSDLTKAVPMNRLLNGDVGSGKTVVAAIAAQTVVESGFRVAVMCPTSILANQHYETFCKLFEEFDISVGLVTSDRQEKMGSVSVESPSNSKTKKSKQEIKKEALSADIIIGTQALIQKDVEFEKLGLVIVDEQHRFGVVQRAALQQFVTTSVQGKNKPHFLSMTATPIPRTMHLALFGDLDLTLIKQKPANRKEIKTRFVESHNREKAYEFIREHIRAGRQAFVICPLIEEQTSDVESEVVNLFEEDSKSVKSEYEKLQKIFPKFKIGMLHGKMKAKEKDEVMAEFVANRLNILVSTSVVEVGVDIPNATVMMIEDAERFGLAQIHQFRGRVGRGDHQSFCFLFSSTMSPKAIERLESLETTSDGFKLAEIDLETRGPGAMFGTEQSGLLDLKMASFSDSALIEKATMAAKSVVNSDPELKNYPLLKAKISEYLSHKHLE